MKQPEWKFWRWRLENKILAGFAVGAGTGLAANFFFADHSHLLWLLDQIVAPIGEVFLRIIFMIIIPLVVSAFILGVTGVGSFARLKQLGLQYAALTLTFGVLTIGTGMLLANLLHPGMRLSEGQRDTMAQRYQIETTVAVEQGEAFGGILPAIVRLIPDNPIRHLSEALTVDDDGGCLPAIIIFSAFISLAILVGPREQMVVLESFFQGLFAVSMNVINFALNLAPICVTALAFDFTARLGLEIVASMSIYLVSIFAVFAMTLLVIFPLVLWRLARISPVRFYRCIREPFWFAFATSSSSATYPISLRVASEKLKIPEPTARFVMTLGAVANQAGSSVFVAVSSLFLAEIFGVEVTLFQQLQVFAFCVAFSFATPGVPGGNLPVLASVCVLIGVPPAAIAIVLGVDRIIDMGVTVVNVTSDLVVAAVLGRPMKEIPGSVAQVARVPGSTP